MPHQYKIGIDIGGTRTHAVLCEDEKIIVAIDVPTTSDTKKCVIEAINQILSEVSTKSLPLLAGDITAVMIGTTRFVNNILQSKGLNKVFVIRLGAPVTTAIPPLSDWPMHLQQLIGEHRVIINGGYEFTSKEITALDNNQVKSLGEEAVRLGIQCIAVAGVFSHIKPDQENEVYKILKTINPNFRISLSHQIGDLGFLARENATILNAALSFAFESFCQGIRQALIQTKIFNAKLLLSSNNGTIEKADAMFPVKTYGSGPSNSIRGAARLLTTESEYFIVADIGGTSTDIGINHNGFPIPAGTDIKIGNENDGFICNFPSPLTFSCALGGGTIISKTDEQITIGPESVGHDLHQAISFGGKVLTVTDIALAKGRLNYFGNENALLKSNISLEVIEKADDIIHQKLAAMINMAVPYVDKNMFPVVLVGGGASLFDLEKLKKYLNKSINKVIIPPFAASANAVGACIAKVSGQFGKIYQYEDTADAKGMSRDESIKDARQRAIAAAIDKGANSDTIKELGITEIPINYLPGALHRIKVEVMGEYLNTNNPDNLRSFNDDFISISPAEYPQENIQQQIVKLSVPHPEKQNFADMALGAALLGSGGGGDTYLSEVMLYKFLEKGMAPNMIELSSVNDDMNIIAVAFIGAPSVGNEKLPSNEELIQLIQGCEDALEIKINAVVPAEGGGSNAIFPFSVAVAKGLPMINADCMGRAFPELPMTVPYIYGKDAIAPIAVLCNGQKTIVIKAADLKSLSAQVGAAINQLGGTASIACMPMNGKQAKTWCIPNTLSFCRSLGAAIRSSTLSNRLSALTRTCLNTGYGPITPIGSGRIIELNRNCEGGFNRGWVIIETPAHEKIKIEFQNENLRAVNCVTNHVLALVPDIITLLDISGKSIPCELLRVGLEVASIIVVATPAILKTPQALAVVGPDQFHLPPIKHMRSVPGLTLHNFPSSSPVEECKENIASEMERPRLDF